MRNVRGSYKRRDKSGIPDKKGKLLTLKGRMRDNQLDSVKIADVIKNTGYTLVSSSSEPYEKKGLFSFLGK